MIPTGFEPGKNSPDAIKNAGGTGIGTETAENLERFPELTQVVTTWPELSQTERHVILSIISGREGAARRESLQSFPAADRSTTSTPSPSSPHIKENQS